VHGLLRGGLPQRPGRAEGAPRQRHPPRPPLVGLQVHYTARPYNLNFKLELILLIIHSTLT